MKIVYIAFSDLRYDQRIKQELKTLSKQYDVYSVSIGKNSGNEKNIEIQSMSSHGFRFIISWFKFFIILFHIKPDLLFFADVNTVPPAIIWQEIFNIPIIFDMHEIGSEMKDKQNYIVKLFWKTLEFIAFKRADAIITVSKSLSSYIKKRVKREVQVLYNYPSEDIWHRVSEGNRKNVCYVGNLFEDRGLELLVKAFKKLNGYHLNIIGGGSIKERLQNIASGLGYIEFSGVVPIEKLPDRIAKSGIGIVLNEGKSMNNRLGLPNKIFQYISMGMPFVCSTLPEMERIIIETEAGVVCNLDVESIIKAIEKVSENYSKFRGNAMKYRKMFVWEIQERKLIDLVNQYE